MARFFTSDTHFRHEMVIKGMNRGNGRWKVINDHDDDIIANINTLVGRNDELYILGDIAWADLASIRLRINSRHIKVVLGNHDKRGHLISIFGEAPDTRTLKVGEGNTIFLSHYPHAFWPRSHYGSYHLYGHMHAQREGTLTEWMPERRSLDVGLDNAARLLGEYRPFTEAEVLSILDKPGHDPLEYYRGASKIESE